MRKSYAIKIVGLMLMLTFSTGTLTVRGSGLSIKKRIQLKEDLEKVWPFTQTVKVEYDLVMVQLEMMDDEKAKKEFLLDFENYIKDKYFDEVIKLNVRQGKLLLLLIDREIGRTPFDLLKEFLNISRADFWQKCAQLLGADLNLKYNSEIYPEIEDIVRRLSKKEIQPYIQ